MVNRALLILSVLVLAVLSVRAVNEIQLTDQLNVEKGILQLQRKPGVINIDMNGDSISDIVQSIETGSTNLITVAADVGTNGVYWFRNLTTNTAFTIDIGTQRISGATTNFCAFLRLQAEELSNGRLHPTNLYYAVANGGTVNLRTIIVED